MNRAPGDSQFHSSNSQDSPRFQEPYNIFQFYNSDGPWIPQGVIQPADTLNSSSRPSAYNSGAPSFHGYRSTGLPSDCGTAPDDSGYGGTRSAYSFAESVAGNDRCAENAYLETTADQMIGDLTINQIYQPSQMQHHQASTVEFLCNHCGHSCKTKSELKKHSARHEKPYKCTYETCTKAKQGFSTPNDLARHKKTVHREHNENDPIYICHHGGCSRKKEKLWPRADNFRSHLSRSHNINLKADSDLGEYRHKPNTAKPLGRIQDKTRSTAQVNPGHRPMQLQDAPPVYTCPHHTCPQAKGKTWPTADDLRAHLSHDHNLQLDDDLKGYHFQLEATEAHTLRGVGSSIADVDPEPRPAQLQDSPDLRGDQVSTTASGQVQDESSKQSDLPLTQTCLTSGDRPPQMRSSILDALKISSVPGSDTLASQPLVDLTCADDVSLGESEAMLPHDEVTSEPFDHEGDDIIGDEEILDRQEPLMLQITSPTASVQLKADSPQDGITESLIATQTSGQVFEASTEAPPADTPTFEPCKASGLFPLLDNVPTGQILSFLRNIPKELLEKALKPEDPSASGNDDSSDLGEHQKAEINCRECGKAFSRNCELRKHMKRHEKPYGCTYKTCCKKFGSKNDWKRHESSQHFQLESWNCNLDGCDKVLPRRELFKWHLINHHKVQDSQKIDKLQEERRLGRHCDPRFWCGFCDKFVEITGEVVNSWTKRCDHIDSHLFGKDGLEKKNMLQWHYLEDKLAEGEPEAKLAESSSRASKKRKATEDVSSRPSKRTNFNSFKCCNCGNVESYHTCASCQECQHQRCGHCKIEGTVVPDDDDTEMVNMN